MISKIKTFFRTYFKSISEPGYYNHILEANFWFSFKYFAVFYLLLAIAYSALFAVVSVPEIKRLSSEAIDEVTTNYPSDLVISITDNQLTVASDALTQPILVPFPSSVQERIDRSTNYDYLFSFDSRDDISEEKAVFNFAQHKLIIRSADDTKQELEYSEFGENVAVNRQGIQLFASSVQTQLDKIISWLPLAVFGYRAMIVPVLTLIRLVLFSLILLLAISSVNLGLSYGKAYQLSLHIITFAETANFLQKLLFSHTHLPRIYELAFIGVSFMVILALRPRKARNK